MYPFFESIRVLDGAVISLDAHQQRVDSCLRDHNGQALFLKEIQKSISFPANGLYKWRLQYSLDGLYFSELLAYRPKLPSQIELVAADLLQYSYKFQDRGLINTLLAKSHASDIIMIKYGRITDASYSNLVFFDGKHWVTPVLPILKGTQRSLLLEKKIIHLKEIGPEDLKLYSHFKRINAMMPFNESPILITKDIITF
ncbi:MAG: hypothetical protein QNL28_05245 [Flavobacteriaceae bacterium]